LKGTRYHVAEHINLGFGNSSRQFNQLGGVASDLLRQKPRQGHHCLSWSRSAAIPPPP
jgi:hypothetical protein